MSIDDVEILRAACCVAAVGGEISPREMLLLRELVESAGVGEASFYAMIDRATSDPGFFKEQLSRLTGDAETAIRKLARLAAVDGGVSPGELKMLRHFAAKIGMEPERAEQVLAGAKSPG